MPKSFRFFIGSSLGTFIRISNPKRSNIVMTNLSLCFKTMSPVERKRIHDRYFKNLGKAIIDLPSLWLRSDDFLQKRCDVINRSYIDNELSKGIKKEQIITDPGIGFAKNVIQNLTILQNLGTAHKELGEFDEAIKLYNKVLNINPKHTNSNYNLGLVFYKLNGLLNTANRY